MYLPSSPHPFISTFKSLCFIIISFIALVFFVIVLFIIICSLVFFEASATRTGHSESGVFGPSHSLAQCHPLQYVLSLLPPSPFFAAFHTSHYISFLLASPLSPFPPSPLLILIICAAKLGCIYWQNGDPSHAAEVTAGYMNYTIVWSLPLLVLLPKKDIRTITKKGNL